MQAVLRASLLVTFRLAQRQRHAKVPLHSQQHAQLLNDIDLAEFIRILQVPWNRTLRSWERQVLP